MADQEPVSLHDAIQRFREGMQKASEAKAERGMAAMSDEEFFLKLAQYYLGQYKTAVQKKAPFLPAEALPYVDLPYVHWFINEPESFGTWVRRKAEACPEQKSWPVLLECIRRRRYIMSEIVGSSAEGDV